MINIGSFLSVTSQLALEACELIRDGSQNKDLKTYDKGGNDPVTETDFKVQTMIIGGIHKYFPNIKIVGEETVKYDGQIHVDYQNLTMDFTPQNSKLRAEQVSVEQLCVWIDPIDCTKGFVDGKLQYVTVLIGLSRKLAAYAGVIGTPFKNVNEKRVYSPDVTIGLVSTQQTYKYTVNKVWEKVIQRPLNNPLVFTTTSSMASGLFSQLMQTFKATKKIAGGSGNKIMTVVNGQADLMCYLAKYTCKWDSCAGEAIVKSLGGYFSEPRGDQLVYDPQDNYRANSKGFMCSLDKQLYQKALLFLKNSHQKK